MCMRTKRQLGFAETRCCYACFSFSFIAQTITNSFNILFFYFLGGYTVHLALSIFCSLKLASSALLYVLLQLTQNLASLYKDRNVLVDWQRGQFVNLGFNSDFFCNLSHVSNIVNPLMIFIFIFPYRYNL